MSRRCVVIGGGVVGVMTALRLVERGAKVTLVDASAVGSGTSARSFAHVNASYAGYWDYFELRAAGVAGYRRLRSELGGAPWLMDTGFLQFEESAAKHASLAEHAERLRDADYPVARVSAERVRCYLQPDLEIGTGVEDVFFYPDEGYVEVQPMIAHLLATAAAMGLKTREHAKVVGFETAGDRVRGVALETGEHIAADVVVCCCGRWTDAVLALAGIDVELMAPDSPGSIAPGLHVVSEPVASRLRRVVCANGLNIRPDGAGRLMIWSGDLDARVQALGAWPLSGPSPALPPELAREALDIASRHFPVVRGARVENAYVCVRALPRDGLPVVGWLPQAEGVYVIAAHAGVTLAPILGELGTCEIVDLREDPRLKRFRPDRFSSVSAPAVRPDRPSPPG